MDTNSISVIALRVSHRPAKNIAVTGVVSCLALTGFAAAVKCAGHRFSRLWQFTRRMLVVLTMMVPIAYTLLDRRGEKLPVVALVEWRATD
jgi:hypothetical protein